MKKRKKTNTLFFVFLTYLIVFFASYLLFRYGVVGKIFFNAFVYAGALNFLNSLLAMSFFIFSIEGSNKKFMTLNLGGIGVRILLMIIGIIIVIKSLKIEIFDFILVFFVFYFVQLIFEIRYFHNFNKEK